MSPAPDAGSLIEQIAEATGWQHHTIRGAVSGALKKKLGLTVEATRPRGRPQQDRRQAQQHRLPGHRLSAGVRTCTAYSSNRAIGSILRTTPRPGTCSRRASAPPTSNGLLWIKVHELLGRVPKGSTARFVQDGTLPGEAQGDATAYRLAS
jgi:hypothetical protein